jgi:hypothetical protein
MKKICSIILALCFYCQLSQAFPPADRKITRGTIFNYAVKEGNVSYKMKLTVTEWDEDLNVKLQWQASGGKTIKGSCVQAHSSLVYATEMKIQLPAGDETLPAYCTRWFAGHKVYDLLYNDDVEADMKIDNKRITFEPDAKDIEKKILYNNVKTSMNYAAGKNSSSTIPITIGFIEYADKVVLLDNYVNGNFAVNLLSIEDPAAKAVAKRDKTAIEMADELLRALAPAQPVPLKKMEAAKFAKVRSNYPLLATIENYDGTNAGKVKKPITETYEFRYEHKSPNPPSLVDCFTADLQILYKQKSHYGIVDTVSLSNKSLPSATAKKILEAYLNYEYNNIPGYRPWTHWRFVKGLTESQREQLAAELQGYISQYGFTE